MYNYRNWKLIFVASVSFALLFSLGLFLGTDLYGTASSEVSSSTELKGVEALSAAFIEVSKKTNPSVVNISVTLSTNPHSGLWRGQVPSDDPFWEFFDDFFKRSPRERPRERPRPRPQGSGFIVKPDGYILTNHHVIQNAQEIKVTLNDNQEYDAKLIGTDKDTEVAVIKIEEKNLPILPLGNSDELQVGEWVLAVGNPFGLSHTVTNGIISATGRSNILSPTVTYQDFIQTNAAINPGNSGGPLVNLKGEAIGINTAIATVSGVRGNVGIGFAIPINMALDVMDQLIDTGKVVRGWLGIEFQEVNRDIAKKYGLKEPKGALIVRAVDPAKKSGLEPGDLIIEFNGENVKDGVHLRHLVAAVRPEEKIKIKVIRSNKKEKEFEVKLAERTDEALAQINGKEAIPFGGEEEWMGITVQELTEEIAPRLGYEGERGVIISSVNPDGPAAKLDAPLRRGDLIMEIEDKKIENMQDYKKAIKEANKAMEKKDEKSVMLYLKRSSTGQIWFAVLKKKN